jgi:hypothetical protein
MENEQKPLHVIKVKKADITDEEFIKRLRDGEKAAQEKADELAVHFPPGMQMFVSSESDDDELRFYLNFKLEF